jgi:hypothetical protein
MRYLKQFKLDQIVKVLKIEPAENGKYDCLQVHKHNGVCHNSALSIAEDGSFSCLCGIQGKGWVELTSKLYCLPRWRAEKWLKMQLKKTRNGQSTN